MKQAISLAAAALTLIGTPRAQAQTSVNDPAPPPTGTATSPAEISAPIGDRATMPAGTIGVGFVQTISGLTGAEVEYHLDHILISGAIDFGYLHQKNISPASVIGFGIGAFYGLAARGSGALFLGGRLVIAGVDNGPMDGVQVNFEVPMRLQWYISEHFSAHAEVGVALRVSGAGGDLLDGRGKGVTFTIGSTNLINTVGGTIYF
jgi:hypothetical protein